MIQANQHATERFMDTVRELAIIIFIGLVTVVTPLAAHAGSFTGLGDLPGGGNQSTPRSVSGDGSVAVGQSWSTSGEEAFRWMSNEGMVSLGDLPGGSFESHASGVSADGSVVVGFGDSSRGLEAFRWTSAGGMVGLGDLRGGGFSSQAHGASADGSVVVGFGTSASGQEAFRWTSAEGMVGLGDLPGGGFFSQAHGVSADGHKIIGISQAGTGHRPFLWDSTHGMRDLQMVLETEQGLATQLAGWSLIEAWAISADGSTIVGYGRNPVGKPEGWRAQLTHKP